MMYTENERERMHAIKLYIGYNNLARMRPEAVCVIVGLKGLS